MAMNFAPYQSSPPESTRALSPPLRSPTASPQLGTRPQQGRQISSVADQSDPWAAARGQPLPSPSQFAGAGYDDLESGHQRNNAANESSYFTGAGGSGTDVFATSLGMRMEIEASLAYLVLPPAGGVILLLFEHKSDYVRSAHQYPYWFYTTCAFCRLTVRMLILVQIPRLAISSCFLCHVHHTSHLLMDVNSVLDVVCV